MFMIQAADGVTHDILLGVPKNLPVSHKKVLLLQIEHLYEEIVHGLRP